MSSLFFSTATVWVWIFLNQCFLFLTLFHNILERQKQVLSSFFVVFFFIFFICLWPISFSFVWFLFFFSSLAFLGHNVMFTAQFLLRYLLLFILRLTHSLSYSLSLSVFFKNLLICLAFSCRVLFLFCLLENETHFVVDFKCTRIPQETGKVWNEEHVKHVFAKQSKQFLNISCTWLLNEK